MMAVENLSWIQ